MQCWILFGWATRTLSVFAVFLVFNRNLFPGKPELLEELLERTGVDFTVRPQEVGFEDYGKICQSFIEMSREHDLSVTPLRVRKPVPIATERDKETNASSSSNANNDSDASNASNITNSSKASNFLINQTKVTNLWCQRLVKVYPVFRGRQKETTC